MRVRIRQHNRDFGNSVDPLIRRGLNFEQVVSNHARAVQSAVDCDLMTAPSFHQFPLKLALKQKERCVGDGLFFDLISGGHGA